MTLAENNARAHEGTPPMPPDEGYVVDALGRVGIAVSGATVAAALYVLGLGLCVWFGVDQFVR